jgi:DNA mismatch repair ATPase MutS
LCNDFLNIVSSEVCIFFQANERQAIKTKKNLIPIEINTYTKVQMENIRNSAMEKTSELIRNMIVKFSDPLLKINEELLFYRFGLEYADILKKAGMEYVFPEMTSEDDNIFSCSGLYDPFIFLNAYLHLRIPSPLIVKNPVHLDSSMAGILVKGKNNTGKTVFLRSIGISQAFAQAGLPVTASKARISVRTGVFTLFSSKEESAAGRFEAEVKQTAEIIKNISSNALILMNETFQTTSFDEAAGFLHDLLNIFAEFNITFIFVTHIHSLFEYEGPYTGKKVLRLKTYDEDDKVNKYLLTKIDT